MSLTTGLNIAKSALATTSEQTAVVSRNVGNSAPYASRKLTSVITVAGGGVRLSAITRVSTEVLLNKSLVATSESATHRAILDGLNDLDQAVGDPELGTSPAALIGSLKDDLQILSSAPNDKIRAQSALRAAYDVANGLNEATRVVQATREKADADIGVSVNRLNALLADFEKINNIITNGTRARSDVTDSLDTRDRILADISQEIGVKTAATADNGVAIYTDSGVTLFEQRARAVTFQPTGTFAPGTSGTAIFIDGVQVTGATASMPLRTGRIVGLVEVRDTKAVAFQNQLDEIARGLIETFRETDQSATPTLPDRTGLFTYAGGPAVPATGTTITGLAASIRVNPAVDPAQGGVIERIRDGGINGAAYVYNATGGSGYSARLEGLITAFTTPRTFDPSAGIDATATLEVFASNSVSWLEQGRKESTEAADYTQVISERATDALFTERGANLDDQVAVLLELERAYQSSTRLVATIDQMFEALLAVTG